MMCENVDDVVQLGFHPGSSIIVVRMKTVLTVVVVVHISLCLTDLLLITSANDNSVPVFEVYDTEEDRVTQVEKVLGKGRSSLGQVRGETRIMENNLLVQYRVETGEAWLVTR